MKKLCLIMALIFLTTALISCEDGAATESSAMESSSAEGADNSSEEIQESSQLEESSVPDEDKISTIEQLTETEAVKKVTKNEKYSTWDTLVYNLEFVSDGLNLCAQVALPANYSEKNYPTVIYFPEVTYDEGFLVDNFAKRGINVIRLSSRGVNGNEGKKDIGGADFADAEMILEICKSADFLSHGGIFTAGAGEGSVKALRLAAEYPDDIMGCTVINVLSDLESICELRGEGITEYFASVIGGTIEELPEEYEKRSATHFAHKIKSPVLIFAYQDTPELPRQQAEILKDAIDAAGGTSEIYDINTKYSDFNGTAFFKLIPWIIKLAEDK